MRKRQIWKKAHIIFETHTHRERERERARFQKREIDGEEREKH